LADRGIDFMKRQKAAGKPFFLYLPISRTHFPNLPSKRFEGQSRIGQFGDSLMEGDALVGKMLDALRDLGLENDTIVVFASDNGPQGAVVRELGGDMPDTGSPGPFRGELGDVSEGSIRTAAIIRWPGHIRSRSSYAMFSIMDFFPTFARLAGGQVPDDRPIDGVDQTDLVLGRNATGRREHLLTFVGPALVAVRWKQFRTYFADIAPGRSGWGGEHLLGGYGWRRDADERVPQGLQCRIGPARGIQHRRDVRVGDRTRVEGRRGIQGESRETSELSGGEPDVVVIVRADYSPPSSCSGPPA
jgi:arylsulfatase A-like enzyme